MRAADGEAHAHRVALCKFLGDVAPLRGTAVVAQALACEEQVAVRPDDRLQVRQLASGRRRGCLVEALHPAAGVTFGDERKPLERNPERLEIDLSE